MITEPEIHEITPESPGPEPDAVSKPGFLNLGPPRNGKIAKLSKELRELLNHMLAEGATGAIIIDRFAGLGISLNHENVSNWKHGGYQDWVLEQDWQAARRFWFLVKDGEPSDPWFLARLEVP